MKCSMTGQEKKKSFNTGDCLIEVTTEASLTVTQLSLGARKQTRAST